MPIRFFEKNHVFKLDTLGSSYAFAIHPEGYLLHLYYGSKIEDADLGYLADTCRHSSVSPSVAWDPKGNFSKDTARMEYPCNGCGDLRSSALSIRRAEGTDDTDILYVSHRIFSGKPGLPGQPATYATEEEADTLEILCRDQVSGAEVTLVYTAFRQIDAITRHIIVKNASEQPMVIERVMSTCLDFHDAGGMDLIHLWGAWSRERMVERTPLIHGKQEVSSKRGCSSHAHNPFLAVCSHDATEQTGEVFGLNLVYTGNFTASAEMDADGGARLLMGINPETFAWNLNPGEFFTAPEAVMVFSSEGLGGMSRTFHRLYRKHLCRGAWKDRRRPILVNNWEATYFQFNEEKLYQLAKTAADLGIEMLVMDDGWFGGKYPRNSDRCGLGDWFVNEEKLKGGLGKLTEKINALGMKFGIWFEPEMVSEQSELYENHPDWVIQTKDRVKSVARHQYVLDMSRPDVRDYLFGCICKVLDNANVSYIKWDFNRSLTEVGSALLDADRQMETSHRYVLGLYDLLERILTAYPDLLLEGCASGGGRFDPAWLYYAPQFWTSDDTDAIERLDIQLGTSICYPASTMGAHVSACPNHQLGRITPFHTRGVVALSGTFGYELDLTKLTDEEKEQVREQCKEYRKYSEIVREGDMYRLIDPWDDRTKCAWMYVSTDKQKAIVSYVVIRHIMKARHYLRLAGLNPDLTYLVEETGQTLSGKALMCAGLNLQNSFRDATAFLFHLKAVEK